MAKKINDEIEKIKELEARQAEENRAQEAARREREAQAERERQDLVLSIFGTLKMEGAPSTLTIDLFQLRSHHLKGVNSS